jgi:peroxiredoxin Q/BCP
MGTMLEVGAALPSVTLRDELGESVELGALKGPAVIYFYPKDMTPGCTTQAQEFEAHLSAFQDKGYQVIGVSPDGPKRHAAFREKYGLSFRLLCDEEHEAAEAFGVWREKKNYGKTYMGIVRSTFVVDEAGRVSAVFENVRAAGHAERVLSSLP